MAQAPPAPPPQSGADIVRGLARRWQIPWLLRYQQHRLVLAGFSFLAGGISIALMAALALVVRSPFVFPSLGPTAFLFFDKPLDPSSSPRNALVGHTIALLVGYGSLWVTGLTTSGATTTHGVSGPRILAAGLMVLLRAAHPPAGATTLIVSLGIIARPDQLLVLLGGVMLLIAQALVINRLAGIPYPFWASPAPPISPENPLRAGQ